MGAGATNSGFSYRKSRTKVSSVPLCRRLSLVHLSGSDASERASPEQPESQIRKTLLSVSDNLKKYKNFML